MKETGIIMSGNHPKLILDGIKTMTRRVIKPQPTYDGQMWDWRTGRKYGVVGESSNLESAFRYILIPHCPYGQVGDRLVIKETWATENQYNHLKPSEVPRTAKIWYLADEQYSPWIMGKVRSAMFMCNWMSRARPEITEIRVERVQEITEEDARADTVHFLENWGLTEHDRGHRGWFKEVWDSLNAKRKPTKFDREQMGTTEPITPSYEWASNPFVWVISFKLVNR